MEYKQKGYKSVAIISKTEKDSEMLSQQLLNMGITVSNVNSDTDLENDEFTVWMVSNQLVKGLEFDAVILNDVNDKNYSSDSQLDMKLLYVAVTRALHELDVTYTNNIATPLRKFLSDSKDPRLTRNNPHIN